MSAWPFLNRHRIRSGTMGSDDTYGFNGAFILRLNLPGQPRVKLVASDGEGWQHVSVSLLESDGTPSWRMMCAVRDLFWEPKDWVVQFHPAASDYINLHPGCLHLWRPLSEKLPTPPFWMVGPKEKP